MGLWIEARDGAWREELTGCCTTVKVLQKRNDGASVLTAALFYDQKELEPGCRVMWEQDGYNIFKGTLFSVQKSSGGTAQIRAYDQLRYMKTKDTMQIGGQTIGGLLRQICRTFELQEGSIEDSGYVLWPEMAVGRTLLDMLYQKIAETECMTGEHYVLRDEWGKLCLRRESSLSLPLCIADATICTGYTVTRDIENTYNRIVLGTQGSTYGMRRVSEHSDAESIRAYGVLQYYQRVAQTDASSDIQRLGANLLEQLRHLSQRFSLEAIGDFSVCAGCVIGVELEGLGTLQCRVLEVAQWIQNGIHRMTLEVEEIAG